MQVEGTPAQQQPDFKKKRKEPVVIESNLVEKEKEKEREREREREKEKEKEKIKY